MHQPLSTLGGSPLPILTPDPRACGCPFPRPWRRCSREQRCSPSPAAAPTVPPSPAAHGGAGWGQLPPRRAGGAGADAAGATSFDAVDVTPLLLVCSSTRELIALMRRC